jgi:hypothetical protein
MTNCVFAQFQARRASKSAHAVVDSGRHEAVRWHLVVHGEDADIISAWGIAAPRRIGSPAEEYHIPQKRNVGPD